MTGSQILLQESVDLNLDHHRAREYSLFLRVSQQWLRRSWILLGDRGMEVGDQT